MTTFFTSDTHFGHNNIIGYSRRPFAHTEEMDEALIANWNATVSPEDSVYHLGDFSLSSSRRASEILRRLHGRIHLLEGNHDGTAKAIASQFASYSKFLEVEIEGCEFTLCHFALRVWNRSHHGAWHLYGHSHGSLLDDPHSLSFDVGTDCHGYRPISIEEVRAIMARKSWRPVDHHVESTPR